jgi:hypothetical protein
MPLSQNG